MDTTPDYKEALELVKLRIKEDGITVNGALGEYARLVGMSTAQALRDVGRQLLDYRAEIKALPLKKLVLKEGLTVVDSLLGVHLHNINQCGHIVENALAIGYEIDRVTAYNTWRAYDEEYNVTFAILPTGKRLERVLLQYCNIVE